MSRLLIALPMLAAAGLAHAASAVPVSPVRTTVVAGQPQVFSARFYDGEGHAQVGQSVSFFNDACGTFDGGGFLGQATTDARGAGSPWLGKNYDASEFRMSEIGWYAMRYNEDGSAIFQYSMGGAPVTTLPLTRIPF